MILRQEGRVSCPNHKGKEKAGTGRSHDPPIAGMKSVFCEKVDLPRMKTEKTETLNLHGIRL